MAAGDVILSQVSGGLPFFPCGPCSGCNGIIPGDIDATVASIVECSCQPPDAGIGGAFTTDWKPRIVSGINGVFSGIPYVGSNIWQQTVGVVDFDVYTSSTGICSGLDFTLTRNADIIIICQSDGTMQAFVACAAISGKIYSMFNNAVVHLDTLESNTNVCGTNLAAGFGGTMEVSAP